MLETVAALSHKIRNEHCFAHRLNKTVSQKQIDLQTKQTPRSKANSAKVTLTSSSGSTRSRTEPLSQGAGSSLYCLLYDNFCAITSKALRHSLRQKSFALRLLGSTINLYSLYRKPYHNLLEATSHLFLFQREIPILHKLGILCY